MLTQKEVAVLLDTDGTIFSSLANNVTTAVPWVACGMTDPHYPKLMHEQFGGYLAHRKSEGPNKERVWHWSICGRNCHEVLTYVLPEIRIKRQQAEAALLMSTLVPKKGGKCTDKQKVLRWRLHDYIKQLNKTGPRNQIDEVIENLEVLNGDDRG